MWDKLYTKRLEWAYKSEKKFKDLIKTKEFKNLYDKGEDGNIIVAVYGSSQVGKTTLILKLIGIKTENFSYVSNILRAGIPNGYSVTATSTIYLKSDDNNFYFKSNKVDEIKISPDGLIEKLKNIRNKVENNNSDTEKNIVIKIPNNLFFIKDKLNINIIDLPGVNSANIREHEHVNKIIKEIIPIANIILLVGRRITEFGNMNIPVIANWFENPDMFRLILTYSITNNSIKEIIKKSVDEKEYLKHFKKEFNETLQEKYNNNIKIYPLEYGNSWEKLETNQPELKEKTEYLISNLFSNLIKDINKSSSEYNQLMVKVKYWKIIEKKIIKSKDEFITKINKITKQINLVRQNIENINGVIKIRESEISQNQKLIIQHPVTFDFQINFYYGDKNMEQMKIHLSNFTNKIKEEAFKYVNSCKEEYSHIKFSNQFNFTNTCLRKTPNIKAKLDDYVWWSKYWSDKYSFKSFSV